MVMNLLFPAVAFVFWQKNMELETKKIFSHFFQMVYVT